VFDLTFIDADKESYLQYFETALARLSANGMIVIDNALWSGKMLEQNPLEESTMAVKTVNQFIRERPELQSVLLPLRDGVHLVTRISA
jgi:caffeoyl-CoA O-methyltransferase